MSFHHPFTFPLFIAIVLVGLILSMIAARTNSAPWFVPLWSRKRDTFTATGWRYRTWSVWCGYASIALLVADQLFAS
jgi:hypothetical protein